MAYRSDIESHWEELFNYSVLWQSVYVDDSLAVAMISDNILIADRDTGTLYTQKASDFLHYMTVSGGKVIFRVHPGDNPLSSHCDASIKAGIAEGKDILISISLDKLKGLLR